MIRVFKDNPVSLDGKIYDRYIKLTGFKDDLQQDIIFKKIERLLKEHQMKVKVY